MELYYIILTAVIVLAGLMLFQLTALWKLVELLQDINMTIWQHVLDNKKIKTDKVKKSVFKGKHAICQNCKYRLSYIQMGGNAHEDFYYKCKIRNIKVGLNDSCTSFKEDK